MEAAAERRKYSGAQYSGERMGEIAEHTAALLEGLKSIVEEAAALTQTLTEHKEMAVADQWVASWGETVNKKTAADMLGVSASQITKMVTAGILPVTPDGRVIVREAAQWAHSGRREPERKQRPAARRKVQAFVP